MYENQTPAASPPARKTPFWRAFWPFGDSASKDAVARLYHQIVARARSPVAYETHGLLDTMDNRREWLSSWAALVMIRLCRSGAKGSALAQDLFDHAFKDLERNFREHGVSDISIAKQVTKASAAFMARYKVIEEAAGGGDLGALAKSLERHMTFAPQGAGAEALAQDLMQAFSRMCQIDDVYILTGKYDIL